MSKRHGYGLAVIAACAVAAGCGGGSSSSATTGGVAGAQKSQTSGVLVGAGSSLVAPLVAQWTGDYAKKHNVTLTYGAIGSGGGVSNISSNTVDFGASDAPLQGDQKSANLVQLPWALAATVVAVNLPGVKGHPKLTGPVLADIYTGKVKTWNDPEIAKLNAGMTLPSTKIAVFYRSDSSGDTFAFTNYLSQVSPQWKSKVGAGTEVSWPTGTGAKGNAGVAGSLGQTPGAIAYIAIGQVQEAHLNYALLRNPSGQYPDPSPATIAQAASHAKFAADHSASILNEKTGYPISTFTYVIVRKDSQKLATLRNFLRYAVGTGQSFATDLSFAPLPASVRTIDLKVIGGL